MLMEEGRSLGADGGGEVTWCGWRRAGHLVQMEEGRLLGADGGGQVTWCRWRRAGHLVRMEEGRSLGADGGGTAITESRGGETARLWEET